MRAMTTAKHDPGLMTYYLAVQCGRAGNRETGSGKERSQPTRLLLGSHTSSRSKGTRGRSRRKAAASNTNGRSKQHGQQSK